MTNKLPVSIYIITCLGDAARGEILKAVCENALELDYPEFEVIVSDNTGSYPAEQALEGLDDPRLKIFRNTKNCGFTGNMNLCMERCQYDVIKLHCDDDLLHRDYLNLTIPYVNDETFVVTDYEKYIIGTEPEDLRRTISEPPSVETRVAGYRNDIWTTSYISLPACTIFTKKLFKDLGGYDICSTATDWDFLIEARRHRNVTHVKGVLCYMGIWAESATQKNLSTSPFYFTYETLYTKFRYIRDKGLKSTDHMYIWGIILKQFLWESLRLPAHIKEENYRRDYLVYLGRLWTYISLGKKMFIHRSSEYQPGTQVFSYADTSYLEEE